MLSKDDLLEAILEQCRICIHLHTKLPEGSLDYRPTPEQRSTLELLRYISYCGIGGARVAVEGGWDGYQEVAKRSEGMTAEEFPAAMTRQEEELKALFAELSPEDFATRPVTLPTGVETTCGKAMLALPLSWLIGYRMQLFLYAKAAGNKEIWTPNCWAGVDWPRDQAPA